MIDAVRGELVKLRSVPGPLVSLALVPVISVGVGALNGWSGRQALTSHSSLLRPDFTAQQSGFDGVQYGMLALIVFGVLAVSGDPLGPALLAVPRRGAFMAAKMIAITVAALPVVVVSVVASDLATQMTLGPYGKSLGESGVPRALGGAVLYLMLMCVLAAGFTMMTRTPLVPLAVLLPLVTVGSQLLTVAAAGRRAAELLPDRAGARLLTVRPEHDALGPMLGGAVLVAWVVAAVAGGALVLRRRDV
ncbi:ABC transporter permease [Actinomadura harenae]|uniref:ABC transporter permease n=1 Tax=Actinomadura harenae TaxID=2483351 RepID=A0A3M2LNK7_9ACTN|nr:ABC transporter permease [Actinomadura harenae]RMI38460.1 ABC transporter permease [Actinomadura harenae]